MAELNEAESTKDTKKTKKEKKMEETEVCFLMDRFGYMRLIDKNAYERNKEAAHNENRCVFL